MHVSKSALLPLLVVGSLCVVACASDPEPTDRPPPPPGDGSVDDAAKDGTPSDVDGDTPPATDTAVDDGSVSPTPSVVDVEPSVVEEPAHTPPPDLGPLSPDKSDPRAFIHDRVILKPKPGVLDKAALKTLVERATGAPVADVKGGPRGTFLIVFAPAASPRDQAAQDALVTALSSTNRFEYVEADRLMTAR